MSDYKAYEVKVYADGTKEWFFQGKLHREDGPAIEYANGAKSWYLNGKLHREDGPAVLHANGTKFWYFNDKLHREDGPAMLHADGLKFWYLNDKCVSEAEHKAATSKSCANKRVLIDGVEYKLVQV